MGCAIGRLATPSLYRDVSALLQVCRLRRASVELPITAGISRTMPFYPIQLMSYWLLANKTVTNLARASRGKLRLKNDNNASLLDQAGEKSPVNKASSKYTQREKSTLTRPGATISGIQVPAQGLRYRESFAPQVVSLLT